MDVCQSFNQLALKSQQKGMKAIKSVSSGEADLMSFLRDKYKIHVYVCKQDEAYFVIVSVRTDWGSKLFCIFKLAG